MSRKAVERNIAFDDIKKKYYVTLDYGKDEFNNRVKKTKTFDKLIDARKCLTTFEANKFKNNLVLPRKDTNESYAKYWLNDVKAISCKQTTLYAYANIINNHIIPILGKIELQKLTVQHLNKYFAKLKRDKGLDNNTLKKHQDLIKSMLQMAVAEEK